MLPYRKAELLSEASILSRFEAVGSVRGLPVAAEWITPEVALRVAPDSVDVVGAVLDAVVLHQQCRPVES